MTHQTCTQNNDERMVQFGPMHTKDHTMIADCNAYDMLVVRKPDGSISSSRALVYFGHTLRTEIDSAVFELSLVLIRNAEAVRYSLNETYCLDPDTLMEIVNHLNPGRNFARLLLIEHETQDIKGIAHCNVFLWDSDTPISLVDVDGTITKTTLSGFWNSAIRLDFSGHHCHTGICPFVNQLDDSTNIIYLTNRPITYASITRSFLESVEQDGTGLPDGLLIGFMGTLAGVFEMDFYSKNAHEFKLETITRHVASIFTPNAPNFSIGLGNTPSDMFAMHHLGVERIYWVDARSTVHSLTKDGEPFDTPHVYITRKSRRFRLGFQDEDLLPHALGQLPDDL